MGANRRGGFTLLELTIVLFVVGLMLGLVAPRLSGRIEAIERQSQLEVLEDVLLQLPRLVRLAGRTVELPRDAAVRGLRDDGPLLALPEGWDIEFTPPLIVSPLGTCSGAQVRVRTSGPDVTEARYEIASPTCELRMPDAAHRR